MIDFSGADADNIDHTVKDKLRGYLAAPLTAGSVKGAGGVDVLLWDEVPDTQQDAAGYVIPDSRALVVIKTLSASSSPYRSTNSAGATVRGQRHVFVIEIQVATNTVNNQPTKITGKQVTVAEGDRISSKICSLIQSDDGYAQLQALGLDEPSLSGPRQQYRHGVRYYIMVLALVARTV